MTPLSALLARWVPQPLVAPMLVAIYTAMIVALMLAGGAGEIDIAYIDVGRK